MAPITCVQLYYRDTLIDTHMVQTGDPAQGDLGEEEENGRRLGNFG